ncbi:MAG: hypothetical protein ACO3A1_02935 [Flavobacteriaceae bacterium]
MKNNSFIFTLIVFMGFWQITWSQKTDFAQIKALKVAHFTEAMDLSPEQAAVFWPIYNEHESAFMELMNDMKSQIKTKEQINSMTELEAHKHWNKYLAQRKKMWQMDLDLYEKLTGKLSKKQMVLLVHAEETFKRKLFHQYRERRDTKKQE